MNPRTLTRRLLLAALASASVASAIDRVTPAAVRGPRRATPVPPPRLIPEDVLQLAGTCVMSGWHGTALPAGLRGLIHRGALGGVLIAAHNFTSRAQLIGLCDAAKAAAPAGSIPLIAADQEGGPVAHLSPPLPFFPSMTALGAIDDTDLTRRVGVALGDELRAVGVNFNLAPVLDVRTSRNNVVILNRTFGSDPARVARHGRAVIDGLTSAGMLSCAKHFPGHGDTTVDSHMGLPRVAHDLARLDAVELVPFVACGPYTPAVMLAHVVYAGVDAQNPASLSHGVIHGILREHMSYDGLAMSDDLQMMAIRAMHPGEQAAEISMRAGCDLLLFAHSPMLATRAIRHLAGVALDDATFRARLEIAAGRVRTLRARMPTTAPTSLTPTSGLTVSHEAARRLAALPARRRAAASAIPPRDPTLRR